MEDAVFKWQDELGANWVAHGEVLCAIVTRETSGQTYLDRLSRCEASDVSWRVGLPHYKGPALAHGSISGGGVSILEQKKLVASAKVAAMSALKLLDRIEEEKSN